MSFLGYPGTTGVPYVDYFIADPVSAPVEYSQDSFVEKLMMSPPTLFVTDYAESMAHVPRLPRMPKRSWLQRALYLSHNTTTAVRVWPREETSRPGAMARMRVLPLASPGQTPGFVLQESFVFATFSNYQKLSPHLFDAWCNILRRVPNSVLWILQHHGAEVSTPSTPERSGTAFMLGCMFHSSL